MSVTWRRGQLAVVTWSKNNHPSVGFSRLSLVPMDKARSVSAHQQFAFWWGCWGSGQVTSKQKAIYDTDLLKRAYVRKVRVPTVIPDGVYLLGVGTLYLLLCPFYFVYCSLPPSGQCSEELCTDSGRQLQRSPY